MKTQRGSQGSSRGPSDSQPELTPLWLVAFLGPEILCSASNGLTIFVVFFMLILVLILLPSGLPSFPVGNVPSFSDLGTLTC